MPLALTLRMKSRKASLTSWNTALLYERQFKSVNLLTDDYFAATPAIADRGQNMSQRLHAAPGARQIFIGAMLFAQYSAFLRRQYHI